MQTEMRKAVYPMKMERLIGILSILLQLERVTAPETDVICVAIHTLNRPLSVWHSSPDAALVGVFLTRKRA